MIIKIGYGFWSRPGCGISWVCLFREGYARK